MRRRFFGLPAKAVVAAATAATAAAAAAAVSTAAVATAGVEATVSATAAPATISATVIPADTRAGEIAASRSPVGGTREAWIAAQIERIAAAEGFADWVGARRETYPLGPGTHGWRVILLRAGRSVGFMTVYDDGRGGWMLGEYGRGEPPA